MRTLQVNFMDYKGGAARAAHRLYTGLRRIGHTSKMLVRKKELSDSNILKVNTLDNKTRYDFTLGTQIQRFYINENRTDLSNSLFSIPYLGYDISDLSVVENTDIINLHWLSFFITPNVIRKIVNKKKHIVWTLHDQWAFTGGCHYSAGCQRFKSECHNCPQIKNDPYDISNHIFLDKYEVFKKLPITFITPSKWLRDLAKSSFLLSNKEIINIPNGIDTEKYFPINKESAKRTLDIPTDRVTMLFNAEYGDEKRKGFDYLLEVFNFCNSIDSFKQLVTDNKILLLTLGNKNQYIDNLRIPYKSLGYIIDENKINLIYNAADIFILPSLEDNLPNTMLESMSCGTPVISFDVGGMPDLIKNNYSGWLIPKFDTIKMAKKIFELVINDTERKRVADNARRLIESECSLITQSKRYEDVYNDLIERTHNKSIAYFNGKSKENDLNVSADYAFGEHFVDFYKKVSKERIITLSNFYKGVNIFKNYISEKLRIFS